MNLTTIYNHIKSIVQAIDNVKLVTWFNNQIEEGIIHTEPAVFIQFPDTFNLETLGHDHYQQAPMVVTIQLVTKLIQAQDGSVNDQSVVAHQTIAQNIFDALHKTSFFDTNSQQLIYNTLARTRFNFDISNGWALTSQTFEAMAYQHPVTNHYTTMRVTPLVTVVPINPPPPEPEPRTVQVFSLGSASNGQETVVVLEDYLLESEEDVTTGTVVLFINNSANNYTVYPGQHTVTFGIAGTEFIIDVPYDAGEDAEDFTVQLVSLPE